MEFKIEADINKIEESLKTDFKISLAKHSQFVLELLKYKDILENFINNNVNETHNFHYLSLPKLSMTFDKDFIERNSLKPQDIVDNTIRKVKTYYEKLPENNYFLETDSEFLRLGTKGEFELSISSMNYKVSYGFQPMILTDPWVYVPQSPQYLMALISATSTAASGLVCGANKIGKKSLLKVLFFLINY